MIVETTLVVLLHNALTLVAGTRIPIRHGEKKQLSAGQIHLADGPHVAATASVALPWWHSFVTRPDLRPPRIQIEGSGSPGYIFFTPIYFPNPDQDPENSPIYQSLVIADSVSGDIVWASTTDPRRSMTTNLRPQTYLGKDVLVYSTGCFNYIVDNSYHIIDRVTALERFTDPHDFKLDNDSMTMLTVEVVPHDLTPYGGPAAGLVMNARIMKLDLRSREVLMDWSCMDHIPLSESLLPIFEEDGREGRPWDYIHPNSLDLHPSDGSILLSSRHTSSLYKINSSSGDIIWRLGGKRSDFIMEEGAKFQAQHNARWLSDNEISIFDNHISVAPPPPPPHPGLSRGIILSLNFENMTSSLKAEFKHPDKPSVFVAGSMQGLPDGNAFLGYGFSGYGSEFDSHGNVTSTYRYRPDRGMAGSYRMLKYSNWTSHPTTTPDVAFVNGTVYMSWNGATEVMFWNIYFGRKSSKLDLMQRVARSGFETAAPMLQISHGIPGFLQVEALDDRNESLAFSRMIRSDGKTSVVGPGWSRNDAFVLLAVCAVFLILRLAMVGIGKLLHRI